MEDSKQILGTEPVGKLLFKYSLPAIIGMLVNGLYNVVDRIFIGNMPGVGPLAITGLGVTMPITTILLAFGMLLGVGTATNISIKLGQGRKDEAERLLGNALTLAVIIGLAIIVIGSMFADQILELFGASPESLVYAKAYVSVVLLGAIFNLTAIIFNSTIRGDGNPKLSATIMVVGCVINIILDALFIFVFNMGIKGAAFATIIAQFVTATWGLIYYTKGKSNLKLHKNNLKLEKSLVVTIIAVGAAPFAMQLAASCVQIISNNALRTHGGDLAIGAMATINSIITIVGMPIVGISQGAQPIIGFNYGCEKYDRVEKTLKLAVMAATIGLTVGWLVVQFFPQPIVNMFNKDANLVAISVDGVRKYLSMMPLIGMSMIGSNYIQSIGHAKQAMFLSLLRQVILLVPLMLILPKFLGLNGVWFAQPTADVISCIVTFIIVRKEIISHRSESADSESVA
ncbi:MATE family efflux transporter [Intestinibacter bartlettii]|uniref:Multidrug export protein MepA n=1 Tax=Intestinibacter bartlettii TaxID=261299 RepID=A0ABS6DUE4_9FIRM|nr:MATE family efflux transporter [Intestinibacter bartlettii]MBU5335453.1 MATE family efflux transporter [Intestinibacter bartlettii]